MRTGDDDVSPKVFFRCVAILVIRPNISSDESRMGNEESAAVFTSAVNAYSFVFVNFR